jgi:hypothetical protein
MPPSNQLLIQVVAQLKPDRCGVSDHALLLARELESAFGIGSAFVVLNSAERCNSAYQEIYCAPTQLLEACISLSAGREAAILVHCSGYGYSTDGAPSALADALERVHEDGRFHTGVYFHELFATSMPWRSAFWHSGRQRQAILRIAKQCDLIATNLSHHSNWLERQAVGGTQNAIQRLPVFSNVGESLELPSLAARRRTMVVFGLPGTRKRAYRRLLPLGDMLDALGIEEILDIGPAFDVPTAICGIPTRCLGVVPSLEVSRLLSESMFGFVPHPPFCLAKSGIFAGFCALGTIPVLADSFSSEVDGLTDGVQLVSPRTAKAALAGGLERCAAAAWNWYSGHRLHIHALTYARLLLQRGKDVQLEMLAPCRVKEA